MSEGIVFIRNTSQCADLGILETERESNGTRDCVINGRPVYIPAGTVYTDRDGKVWRTLMSDPTSFFCNCKDAGEAIRLRIPKERWAFVDPDGMPCTSDKVGASFVGFFGVHGILVDDSKNRAGIMAATANRVESIRHLERLEKEAAAAKNALQDAQVANEQLRQTVEQLRAEVLVLKGRAGDEHAKAEVEAMVKKQGQSQKKGEAKPGLIGAKVD